MGSEPDPAAGERVVEVTFSLTDASYPSVHATREASCRMELVELLPRGQDLYAEFFALEGVDPDRGLQLLDGADFADPALLESSPDGGLFELVVDGDSCPVVTLAEQGANPHEVVFDDGQGRIAAGVPEAGDPESVVARVLEGYPSLSLQAKRVADDLDPRFTSRTLRRAVGAQLTDRQREVLQRAFEAGYYERPRRTSGTELAGELDISVSTFTQHLRAAERKLLALVYGDS
jgi:hypothetical protein